VATEGPDIFAAAGTVASASEIVGILGATEGADTAAFVGVAETADVVIVGGGGAYYPLQPLPVEGVGYGILPALWGEAHGIVVAASVDAAMLRSLAGAAVGVVGTSGHSAGWLTVKAAACGVCGSKGAAVAIVGDVRAAGSGVVVARGKGFGIIGNIDGCAVGRHDDDEAAIAWLLAA
jgi:hypothetical protein